MPIRTVIRLKKLIIEAKKQGISLQKRLCGLFFLFIFIIMLAIYVILVLSGIFNDGYKEQKKLLENELTYIYNNVYSDYGEISIQSVALSKNLTLLIDNYLSKNNITPNEFDNNPEIINGILSELILNMQLSLEKVDSSGVFIILDTTINPALDNSEYSKAGLYIKNMEPNIINASSPYLSVLRGPASLARANDIPLHSQWNLEFNVEDADYFYAPISAARDSTLPISRLYYWSPALSLPGVSEEVMLCSVPLITSNGTVIGVCGFEVSNMLFKLANTPNNQTYTRIFCMLSPISNGNIDLSSSLYTLDNSKSRLGTITPIKDISNTFYTYKQINGEEYAGLYKDISLYPNNSYFDNENWVVSLLMPKNALLHNISGKNSQLLILLSALMIISILCSIYLSKRYIQPIVSAINLMKSEELSTLPRTKIPEINDLFEFLSKQDESIDNTINNPQNISVTQTFTRYESFVKNIDTLTRSERSVFDLYVEGFTANEIAGILFISINTIKTHNKRIYAKLNVSSRKELLVYVEMMKEMK